MGLPEGERGRGGGGIGFPVDESGRRGCCPDSVVGDWPAGRCAEGGAAGGTGAGGAAGRGGAT